MYFPVVEFLVNERKKSLKPKTFRTVFQEKLKSVSPNTYARNGCELLSGSGIFPNGGEGQTEPIMLGIFSSGVMKFTDRNPFPQLPFYDSSGMYDSLRGLQNDPKRMAIVHGESGSGKTMLMIGIAAQVFKADIVLRVHVGVVAPKELHDSDPNRDKKTIDAIVSGVLGELGKHELLPSAEIKDDTTTVAVVLDEIGSYLVVLRALCATHETIASTLRDKLRVNKVTIICGGTGADARNDPGTEVEKYHLIAAPDYCKESVDWREWLLKFLDTPGGEERLMLDHVHLKMILKWFAGNAKMAFVARSLSSNWRYRALLLRGLVNLCRDEGLTTLNAAPKAVELIFPLAMKEFRALNGLAKLCNGVRAAAALQKALAYTMLSLQELIDEGHCDYGLVTRYGLVTQNSEVTISGGKIAPQVGVPRYVMSNALQQMASMALGLRGEIDTTGEAFEDATAHYFVNLFQSAYAKWAGSSFDPVEVALRRDWMTVDRRKAVAKKADYFKPHRMQYVYPSATPNHGMTEELLALAGRDRDPKLVNPLGCDRIELLPANIDLNDHRPLCTFTRLRTKLEPQPRSNTFSRLYLTVSPAWKELAAEAEKTKILVIQNAPKASFADIIVVNNLTEEVWFVQCKCLTSTESSFDWKAEQAKLGYDFGDNSNATRFASQIREHFGENVSPCAIQKKAFRVRYFFSIAAPTVEAALSYFPEKDIAELKKPNVHVLCTKFGFRFDPVDLDYLDNHDKVEPFRLEVDGAILESLKELAKEAVKQ